jgi:Putative beta-barrel porin 2
LAPARARLSDRLNFEIDSRPDRLQRSYSASLALHVLPDTSIEIRANKDETDFDDDELYNGVNLHDQLNRDVTTIRVGASQNVTPLTKVSLTVARQHDRFRVDFTRDMDATHATAAVTFDPQALLRGAFSFSYTRFTPLSATVPSYSGATFGGELSYTLLEVTRFRFAAQRGLAVLHANRHQCRSRAAGIWSG